jgi:acetolactate synthase-1/2/3 large subunit
VSRNGKIQPTVADAIAGVLEQHDVPAVFGLPGVHNLALFDALERGGRRTVIVRHEATAAYAADAVGRLTGRPGVCVTTSGPGAANTAAAMGEAQASRSPLVHVTTTIPRKHLGSSTSRGVLHEHPRQRDIFDPIAKLAVDAPTPARAVSALREALEHAGRPPHGPTYVQVPTDVLSDPAPPAGPQPAHAGRGPVPTRADLRALAARLEAARRPALWVGSGAAGASAAVVALAERLDAPVVLTHSAKRRWSASPHPLVLTRPPHEPAVGELLAEADAVLVLGSDLDAMMTQEFRLPLRGLMRVDVAPESPEAGYRAELSVIGDAEAVLQAMAELVAPAPREDWGTSAARRADERARSELDADDTVAASLGYLDALDRAVGERDATLVCDMAISGYWTGGYLPLAPGRRILYPLGWGTLGFALPASIGAACVPGAGRVVTVCGDGGVLFSIGELATIAQERLDITIVVQNDGGYGMLRYDALRRFDRAFAVDLVTPDFAAIAEGFGIPAVRTTLEDPRLDAVLREAMDRPGPAVVEVGGPMVPPRVTSARWPLAQAGAAPGTAEVAAGR